MFAPPPHSFHLMVNGESHQLADILMLSTAGNSFPVCHPSQGDQSSWNTFLFFKGDCLLRAFSLFLGEFAILTFQFSCFQIFSWVPSMNINDCVHTQINYLCGCRQTPLCVFSSSSLEELD